MADELISQQTEILCSGGIKLRSVGGRKLGSEKVYVCVCVFCTSA